MEFLKIFLIIVACQAPDYTRCKVMEAVEHYDPEVCQLDRIPASSAWRDEIRKQGFQNWEIFTRCQIVNPEKNGEQG